MITLLIQVIIPYSLKLFDLINKNFKKWLITFLAIFIVFDMGISWTALLRQNLRHKGFKPITVIGEFYDRVYPDEVLKKTYNNMKFVNR